MPADGWSVATATRGEHGTPDPVAWPPDALAQVRERELMESLALIDVREHEWLGHSDGSLPDVPFETGVAQVAALLEPGAARHRSSPSGPTG